MRHFRAYFLKTIKLVDFANISRKNFQNPCTKFHSFDCSNTYSVENESKNHTEINESNEALYFHLSNIYKLKKSSHFMNENVSWTLDFDRVYSFIILSMMQRAWIEETTCKCNLTQNILQKQHYGKEKAVKEKIEETKLQVRSCEAWACNVIIT